MIAILCLISVYLMGLAVGYMACWVRYKRDLDKFLNALADAQQQARIKALRPERAND
jgi:hypothetical protein